MAYTPTDRTRRKLFKMLHRRLGKFSLKNWKAESSRKMPTIFMRISARLSRDCRAERQVFLWILAGNSLQPSSYINNEYTFNNYILMWLSNRILMTELSNKYDFSAQCKYC